MNLDGKIAVVTGGTKGIGRAVAESLLKAGAGVFVCARDKSVLKQTLEQLSALGKADGEVCDVRSEAQVKMMFDEARRVFGGVDILVNNAGVGVFGKTVDEIEPDEFRWVLETNLFGVFYACHYAIPLMRERGGGYIINISSLAGQNAHPKMAAYNASKFGLNGFTEAMMQEVRHDNIKVSLICPGSVNTEFGGGEVSPENAWQLQPADIARAVLDLLNHDARSLPSKIEIRPSQPPRK
ncbi:MAG TPA: SDR family oxidoreductase [Pyrinomonadaceae bacterium]|jgi:NAD(P)-dependent dehydrogenase (short-subunit alcohol dehydrogenase family)